MTPPPPVPLPEPFASLRADLLDEKGPRISTMRNYRFAIVQYAPRDEFAVRVHVQSISRELMERGWFVVALDLYKLLLDRVRRHGDEWMRRVTHMERLTSAQSHERGLYFLQQKLTPMIEGPEGLAADCSRILREHSERHPERAERTIAIIGRAGALYPFLSSSGLLRYLDGRTAGIPVLLLYPGTRHGATSLSYMGVLPPNADYRPRIYS
jgi:hypothetical protein